MYKFFERLVNPFPPEHPQQPPRSLRAFCSHYIQGIRWHLAAMGILTTLLAIMEVVLFSFLGQLVDWLSTKNATELWEQEWTTLAALSFMLVVLMPFTVWLHSSIIHQSLLGNFPMRIRWQAHRYLLGQSLSFYQNEFAGRIATKVMQTALSMRDGIMKLLDVLLSMAVYFVGMMWVVAESDWRLISPLIVWLILYSLMLMYYIPRLRAISEKQADARSKMTGAIVDTYTNIMTVKLFSHSDKESQYAKDNMGEFLDTVHPQMRLVTGLNVSLWTLNAVLIFSISALSIWLWSFDAVTTGTIAIAVGLGLRINNMSRWVMWEIAGLFEHIGTIQDGITTLSKPQDTKDKQSAKEIPSVQGAIEFDSVTFRYGKQSGGIANLSLQLKPGEKIGVVGRSGAGKSTLVNLLLRFHDIEKGSIKIDGQDIANLTQDSLRANIGMVTQDTSLLHRSVRENIAYGQNKASDEDIMTAAAKAAAHDFILQLEDAKGRKGYEAQVGERGVKLSGGQRQRIAIARVLLKDAPILVLDEATSALDSEIEAAIQASLYQLMRGKTVIAIAHRLSTIAAMDRLIVLDEGRIVEEGDHKSLLAQNGLYAQLWARQSGGFIGE